MQPSLAPMPRGDSIWWCQSAASSAPPMCATCSSALVCVCLLPLIWLPSSLSSSLFSLSYSFLILPSSFLFCGRKTWLSQLAPSRPQSPSHLQIEVHSSVKCAPPFFALHRWAHLFPLLLPLRLLSLSASKDGSVAGRQAEGKPEQI